MISLVLKHAWDIKEACEQTNMLAGMALSNIAVILQTDWFLLSYLKELLSISDSSKGLPVYLENNRACFPKPHTGIRLCLTAKAWGHLLWMGTDTCRQRQEVVFHQTLHFLTVQLDQAIVEL